jgi:hypothetical protein
MIVLFVVAGCDKTPKYNIYENHDISACGVNDPLRNIEWLKEIISNRAQHSGIYMNIYQCTYNNGNDGFLIEPCVQCDDYTSVLYSCDGSILCNIQGIANKNVSFEEWNIKNVNLIWTNIK